MKLFWLGFLFIFGALSLEAFEIKEVETGSAARFLKWNTAKGPVRVMLNPHGSDDLPIASVEGALRAAMDTWQKVPGQTLRFEYGGRNSAAVANDTDGLNSVQWIEQHWPYSSSTLAITRYTYFADDPPELFDADILVNGESYRWSTGPESAAHPQKVLLHELGHLLGFSHTSVSGAVLFPAYQSGNPTGLSPDEKAAMQFLYGAPVQGFRLITPLIGAVYPEQIIEEGLPLPVFRWGSAGSGQYEVEFSNSSSFQKEIKFQTGATNAFLPVPSNVKQIVQLSPQRVVYWRVSAGSAKTPARTLRFRSNSSSNLQSAVLSEGTEDEEIARIWLIVLVTASAFLVLAGILLWKHFRRSSPTN